MLVWSCSCATGFACAQHVAVGEFLTRLDLSPVSTKLVNFTEDRVVAPMGTRFLYIGLEEKNDIA